MLGYSVPYKYDDLFLKRHWCLI